MSKEMVNGGPDSYKVYIAFFKQIISIINNRLKYLNKQYVNY